MSKGILVHAFNNEEIDYVKQACMVAERVKKYLDLPTSVITDCKVPKNVFDHVIEFNTPQRYTRKLYNNGNHGKHLTFKNNARVLSYDLSPYKQTLMIDTDIIICDDVYKYCFEQNNPLLMYKDAYHLGQNLDYNEFWIENRKYIQNDKFIKYNLYKRVDLWEYSIKEQLQQYKTSLIESTEILDSVIAVRNSEFEFIWWVLNPKD